MMRIFNKLFKTEDGKSIFNFRSLTIELLVVFVGVYLAFLFNNYGEGQKLDVQKRKILVSLKSELEFMRVHYPGMQQYQEKIVKNWKDSISENKVVDFFNWRYVQPQYNNAVVEYAVNSRETGVVDFALYAKLLNVYQALRQVEYAEEKMTELGLMYHPVSDGDRSSSTFLHNQFLFSRFITFASDRASILGRITSYAEEALTLINQGFTAEELSKVEKQIIVDRFAGQKSVTQGEITAEINRTFPKMSKRDVDEVIAEMKKIRTVEP